MTLSNERGKLVKRKKLTKLIGVVFPTGSHDDAAPIYIIAKTISPKLEIEWISSMKKLYL